MLFQELGSRLVFERAEDPNAFLLSVRPAAFPKDSIPVQFAKCLCGYQVLEEMQENKKSSMETRFFTSEDVTTLFEMFDTTGKGSVTTEQYGKVNEMPAPQNCFAGMCLSAPIPFDFKLLTPQCALCCSFGPQALECIGVDKPTVALPSGGVVPKSNFVDNITAEIKALSIT